MKKFLIFLVVGLVLCPQIVLASPGELDQYGGHVCYQYCDFWGYEYNVYHYHFIPDYPNFYTGSLNNLQSPSIFYSPAIAIDKLTKQPAVYPAASLQENNKLDQTYCGQANIFAGGRYNNNQQVRIKPVCYQEEEIVMADKAISPKDYYKELPLNNEEDLTSKSVYHYIDYDFYGRVFTDKPSLEELKGQLIRGVTDKKVYFVPEYSGEGLLREITDQKAAELFGSEYKDKIIVFGDSIVYSYKIGYPMDY